MSPRELCGVVVLCCSWILSEGFLRSDGSQKPATTISAKVGGYAVFNCELDFPQDIEIPYTLNWNKDNITIFSWEDGATSASDEFQGRISLLEGGLRGYGKGSVNMTAIRETDSGWFECRVLFPNRSPVTRNNGTWFRLEVEEHFAGGNLIGIPPVNQTALEGEEALFKCMTKPGDSFVIWYKDGEPISSMGDLSHRSWVGKDGSLVINPTDMTDLGEYTCEVVNTVGDRQTAKASLNVQYKAKVIYTPRDVYLPYGRPALLDCHFRANPPLSNLRWEKDGFLFDPYNVPGVFYRRNGSLHFSKVDESHAGQYSCTPFNELGTRGASPNINVIVQRPPAFTATPNNLYLRRLGESISFPCDAVDSDGSHRPTIIWTKDGGPLTDGRFSLVGGNLTIDNIEESDRGLYQCSATNEAAAVTAETELMIENVPPRAPYNLSAASTAGSVTLRWVPATSQLRPQLEYQVWYRPVDVTEWRTARVSSSKTTEATISNLSPGREYEFMVFSPDRLGEGMFSKSIRVWTKGEVDDGASPSDATHTRTQLGSQMEIGPPRDLNVRLTTDGYLLEWLPPLYGADNLRIYVVRWSFGEEEFLVSTAETKNTYYILDDLEEDEMYHFQVYALSMHDFQAMSSKVSIHVPAYGKIRAAVAGIACVLLLILAGAVFWFTRHKLAGRKGSSQRNSKNGRVNGEC